MSERHPGEPGDSVREARRELRDDRAFEARVLWKGLFALLVVVIVIWLRQTYWV